jgi:DNA (cytosine-5)-methyltransferase 1
MKPAPKIHAPTPAEVRAARDAAGMTQGAAGSLVHVDLRSWQRWESGERGMSPAHWELFQIKSRGFS